MISQPVVLILAAGRGERFYASGGRVHKLDALLAGKPVIDHVVDAVLASGLDFQVVHAGASRAGMGDSIASGVRATPRASSWLILPGDLPLVRSETLQAIALAPPRAVTVPAYRGQRGHPVRFSHECFSGLCGLMGNEGAASVVKLHGERGGVAHIDVDDEGVVTDIDTLDDLARAERLLAHRASELRAPPA